MGYTMTSYADVPEIANINFVLRRETHGAIKAAAKVHRMTLGAFYPMALSYALRHIDDMLREEDARKLEALRAKIDAQEAERRAAEKPRRPRR